MTDTSLATVPQAAEPAKQQRISKAIRRACDAMVNGEAKTVTEAAALVKLSREHLSRYLSKPHINAYLHQKTCRALAMSVARAGWVKRELLESDSDHVRNDASEYLLALGGIKPKSDPQVSLNIEVSAGYVLDLREPASMPHTPAIDLKPLKSQDDV